MSKGSLTSSNKVRSDFKCSSKSFILTIDVEDWFQVENFKPIIAQDSWSKYELRVEKNTHKILDLIDDVESDQKYKENTFSPRRIRATFFILGWIANRAPSLIKEIANRGHEIASHGMNHNLCNTIDSHKLKDDLINSKKLLEDITGDEIYGYRAPSFSISKEILSVVEECGYRYDSSFNSFSSHKRYGKLDCDRLEKSGSIYIMSNSFFELPISNNELAGQILPWGGGAYFRILPLPLFSMGVRSILSKNGTYIFYIHPWELDPSQPRMSKVSHFVKFRHYTNLRSTATKVRMMLDKFKNCDFISCSDFVEIKRIAL